MYVFSHLQDQVESDKTDLAKHLTSTYLTRVAAHLTLQQLQDFSYDVLRSILSIRSMASDMSISENTNTAAV